MLEKTSNPNKIVLKTKITKKDLKSSRGSVYRGVSRNGKKWQVQLLGNLKKHYIGSIDTEAKAARIYDAHAILAHGLKAKTNFSYSKFQIEKIIEGEENNQIFEKNDFFEGLFEDLDEENNGETIQKQSSSIDQE